MMMTASEKYSLAFIMTVLSQCLLIGERYYVLIIAVIFYVFHRIAMNSMFIR